MVGSLVVGPTSVLFLLYYRNIGLFSEESSVLPLVDDIEVGVRYFWGLNALSFFFSRLRTARELNTSSLGALATVISNTAGNSVKRNS